LWKVLSHYAKNNNELWKSASSSSTTRKPLFQKQHYDVIGQLIGQKIVYGIMDDKDYTIIEAFAEMFAEDNLTMFDKGKFRDAVYMMHTQ
jgi:hypothetical protein